MFSPLVTRKVPTPNQSSRDGVTPTFIVLHHMASTSFEGVLNSWATGRKQGSCHYAISNEGEIVGVVPEQFRAWSLSSRMFDSKAIVFEIENESMGGDWPVSAAAHEATARVVADICGRTGIPVNRTQIIGHREVYSRYDIGYATACPGGLDLDWIVARAIPTPQVTEEDEMKAIIIKKPSTGEGILLDWLSGTWRGVYGSETAAHEANGAVITTAKSDKDFDDIKKQYRPWKR